MLTKPFHLHGRPGRLAAALFAFSVLLAPPALAATEVAARPVEGVPGGGADAYKTADPLVRRVQKALSGMGRYHGPIDGLFSDVLEKAVRAYQKQSGLEPDGLVTEELADRLETGAKVGALLGRLARARTETIDAARRALLSRPETRRLIKEGGSDEVADPTRDASPCFRDPTARCLLAEATESAKAVFKTEMRDWALGEVLVAQARAGLIDEAMDTARRIRDPRLIMVALRDIAKAQAHAGHPDDALAAAEIIPDPLRRLEALEAIASIQAERGAGPDGVNGLKGTARRYLWTLKEVKDQVKTVAFLARMAVIKYRAGDAASSSRHLGEAEKQARAIDDSSRRGPALRHVASAHAETGNPARSLALLKEVEDKADHTTVLVKAAAAQAEAGSAEEALATAQNIEAERYRAVVLSHIAVAQAKAGDLKAARETVDRAYEATEEIKRPFAMDFAHNHVALALIEIGRKAGKAAAGRDFEDAVQKAMDIEDDKLRATLLWTIAAAQDREGFKKGAALTEERANEATGKIKSSLSRVWMFSDIALSRAGAGEGARAWKVFGRALKVAEGIDNAWGRARALGKAASTMVELTAVGAVDNVEKPPSE